jgi:signal transduction histidine kinase
MTTWYPWFLWPALGWGFGLFSHWMGVFGSHSLKRRYFDPAVERELQRERATMQTEKQASIGELSSSIAHEIRNPIAAAKSLVQQMGEDPTSVQNVEYAKVALGARSGRAPHFASAPLRQGGGLRLRAGEHRERRRLGADPAPRQARRSQGRRLPQLSPGRPCRPTPRSSARSS